MAETAFTDTPAPPSTAAGFSLPAAETLHGELEALRAERAALAVPVPATLPSDSAFELLPPP